MKTLIIGSGAVGTIVTGILAQRGFDVDIACNNETQASRINKLGVAFKIKTRMHFQPVKSFHSVSAAPNNHYDYAILATKAFDIEKPAKDVLKKLTSNGILVSLQDGYCEEKLARIAGTDRIVGAIVGWGATYNQNNGEALMTSKGEMIIGKLDGSDDPRLDNLQYMLQYISPTIVVNNIHEHIYSKLIINSCVTTLGAISGYNVGALINDKKFRNTFLQIIEEAIIVSDKLKIEIPPYAGKLNYYKLVRGNSLYHRFRKHLYILFFGYKYRHVKSSGLQSLERGEQTEVDFLNGHIVDKAKEMGIDLPINKRLVQMVHEIERKERSISPSNLSEPLFGIS